jgi:hypothetical protein
MRKVQVTIVVYATSIPRGLKIKIEICSEGSHELLAS